MAESISSKLVWTWILLYISGAASTVNPQQSSSAIEARGYYRDRDEYSSDRNLPRCISCAYPTNRRDYDGDRTGYPTRGGYEDRNWYYQPDRNEDRQRYSDRDNGYDDRDRNGYNNRYRDQYDTRYGNNDYRGNGYDNRDQYYRSPMRDEQYYNRDRDRDRDRYYDQSAYMKYPNRDRDYNDRPYYDNRNFRPWDETYRGVSGFDSSGRGYYFANKLPDRVPQAPPPNTYQPLRPNSSSQNSPNAQPPPSPLHNGAQSPTSSPSSPSSSSSSYLPTTSRPGDRGYGNSRDNAPSSPEHYYRDKDGQSPPYGSGSRSELRPLETSYLLDRDSNRPNENGKTTIGSTTPPTSSSSVVTKEQSDNKPEEKRP